MRCPDSFSVTTPSDLEIEIRRSFAAAPTHVFDAFTKPELVRRWLLGPAIVWLGLWPRAFVAAPISAPRGDTAASRPLT